MSTGCCGLLAVASPISRPYQATPALTFGLWAEYIQVTRPPQQKPVMPSLSTLPPFCAAHATQASRSPITCASGAFETMSFIRVGMSAILLGSPWRTNSSGASAR
jgi:hypothetical protein